MNLHLEDSSGSRWAGRGWRHSSEEVERRSLGLDGLRDKVDGTHGGMGRLGQVIPSLALVVTLPRHPQLLMNKSTHLWGLMVCQEPADNITS